MTVAIQHRRCKCGKAPFYSEEAAAFALDMAQRRGRVSDKRRECRYYRCEINDAWHLTSLTVAQFDRRTRLWALCAIAQWGAPVDSTVKVKPGCRVPSRWTVRVTWKVTA